MRSDGCTRVGLHNEAADGCTGNGAGILTRRRFMRVRVESLPGAVAGVLTAPSFPDGLRPDARTG